MPVKSQCKAVVVFIVGPTAIGKTRLSIKLAARVRGQIISADSMQVYKGMETLSQAPDRSEQRAIRHYLIGDLSPAKEYSVADFRNKAGRIVDYLIKNKTTPIVVGGSGLYVRALIDGLFPSPEADMRFRKKMQVFIARYGSKKLHEKLSKIDPVSAGRIHPNDVRRIIRALEIHHSTGRTMTDLKSETRGLEDKYIIRMFGLTAPRERIYSAIDARVDSMFEEGALGEVKRLKKKKLSKTANAVLGYKEICGYINGEYDLETAKDLMKKNTRRFAKRQFTWFRADKRIRWFDVTKMSDENIIKEIGKKV